jgi:hypothetical protein
VPERVPEPLDDVDRAIGPVGRAVTSIRDDTIDDQAPGERKLGLPVNQLDLLQLDGLTATCRVAEVGNGHRSGGQRDPFAHPHGW